MNWVKSSPAGICAQQSQQPAMMKPTKDKLRREQNTEEKRKRGGENDVNMVGCIGLWAPSSEEHGGLVAV
jgi:hypothetical protein